MGDYYRNLMAADPESGESLLRQAAEQGDTDAMFALSEWLWTFWSEAGGNYPTDAVVLLCRAVQLGRQDARGLLQSLCAEVLLKGRIDPASSRKKCIAACIDACTRVLGIDVDRLVVDYECFATEQNEVVIQRYTGEGDHVDVPSSVLGFPVVRIGYEAFRDCRNLVTVRLPASVRRVDDNAFSGCCNLVSVQATGTLLGIGTGAFGGCDHLSSIPVAEGGNESESACVSGDGEPSTGTASPSKVVPRSIESDMEPSLHDGPNESTSPPRDEKQVRVSSEASYEDLQEGLDRAFEDLHG